MKKILMSIDRTLRRAGLMLMILLVTTPAAAESLQQAWEIALKVDHTLKAANKDTASAMEQLEAAKSVRLPGVSLSAGYTLLDDEPAIKANLGALSTEFAIAESSSYNYMATSTLPLYTSGRISSGIDAAGALHQASLSLLANRTIELKLRVAEAYVSVLRVAQGLKVAQSHVTSLEAHANDVENLHEQGMVSRNELLTARVALADARQGAIKTQNALDITQSAYNRLLGRPLNQKVSLDDLKPETHDESVDSLTELALGRRHELLVLQDQIKALNHQAAGIRAETGPQLGLSGGYAYLDNQHLVNEGQWFVSLGVQWKLFDGGVVRHRASATEHQAMAVQAHYDDLVTQVALQVRQYWLDVQETRKRIRVTDEAISQAEENLKVSRDRYENGLSTHTEVLDAETLRTLSQNNHANAVYDAVLATFRLKRVVAEL